MEWSHCVGRGVGLRRGRCWLFEPGRTRQQRIHGCRLGDRIRRVLRQGSAHSEGRGKMSKQVLLGGIVAAAIAVTASTQAGKGTIDAASLKITIYKFALATSSDCAHPTVVFTSDAGVENDLLASPTYG